MYSNPDCTPLKTWTHDPQFRRDLRTVNNRLTHDARATLETPTEIIALFMRRYFPTEYYNADACVTVAIQNDAGRLGVETIKGAMQPFSHYDTLMPGQLSTQRHIASRTIALCLLQQDGTVRSVPLALDSVIDCHVVLPEPSRKIASAHESIMRRANQMTRIANTASFQALPDVTQEAVLHGALADIALYCNLLFSDGLGKATVRQENDSHVIAIRHISPLWRSNELSFLVIDHDDQTYRLRPTDIIDLDIGDEEEGFGVVNEA